MPNELRDRFRVQRGHAKHRGIDWLLSFEEWSQIWNDSGHLAERGSGRGKYVMARRGDVGPYSVANVFIQLFEANARDSRANNPHTHRLVSLRTTGRGRGWSLKGNRYQVMVAGRYVGLFKTAAEAEAAYLVAADGHCALAAQSLGPLAD